MGSATLLVVEDDPDLRSLLRRGLEEEGFAVTAVADGTGALAAAATPPDVLVIDVGLPDTDGRDLCQALRARGIGAPVLFLTARDAVTDRLAGFGAGGDDYLTKPFHFGELVARLRALLRRAGDGTASDGQRSTTVGGMLLDPVSHAVGRGGVRIPLTPTEFRLLATLAARPDAVVRRMDLVRAGWPDGAIVRDNTIDQYVARLRRKLRELGADVEIVTVHGVGYQLR